MRLLLIEDEPSFAEALSSRLTQLIPALEVEVAPAADAAYVALAQFEPDFVVCDLRLPSSRGSADLDIAHGRAVVTAALEIVPGTPVLVLSAFADRFDNIRDLVSRAGREDVHGNGQQYPMVDAEVKDRVDEAIRVVQEFAAELDLLNDIAVDALDGSVLEPWELRVLKIFGRRSRGRSVQVRRLGGGLSPSRTYRVEVYDDRRDRRATVVGKLGALVDVKDERDRLQREIAPRLVEGTFAPYADAVTGGCGNRGGLFCRLLEGFETPLKDLITAGDPRAVEAVAALKSTGAPWLAAAPWDTVKVKELREAQVRDHELAAYAVPLRDMGATAFEARDVQVRSATQHADLHGLNVLMNGTRPQLVDYARVGPSIGGTDPISLEFSLAFHPATRGTTWPTVLDADRWADVDVYAAASPYTDLVIACRRWAQEDAGSPRAVAALGYSWALRQLKFPGVDAEVALAIAKAAIAMFNRS